MKSWGFFLFEDGLLRKMKAFNNLCFKREQFLSYFYSFNFLLNWLDIFTIL